MFQYAIVRVGEISLKKNNRSKFEQLLGRNIQRALEGLAEFKIRRVEGRLMVHVPSGVTEDITEALKRVFGIVSFSPVMLVDSNVDAVTQGLQDLAKKYATGTSGKTFRVEVRRAKKDFPLRSQEAAREFGGVVWDVLPEWKVKMENPDVTFYMDIRNDGTYLYDEVIPGLGGMPAQSSEAVGLLLSGGIDSPVAGWMSMRRGVTLEAIHFHSFPFTSERALEKVQTLANMLADWGNPVVFHTVPFTKIQTEIRAKCPEPLYVTIMRRMMMRISTEIAKKRNLLALVTGESLGQVASQTLESMHVINAVTTIPVLRPLIAQDKVDIIRVSKSIGTYDTSILPYEDCCTVFLPKNPRTRPGLDEVLLAEEPLDIDTLVREAVDETVTETFHGTKLI